LFSASVLAVVVWLRLMLSFWSFDYFFKNLNDINKRNQRSLISLISTALCCQRPRPGEHANQLRHDESDKDGLAGTRGCNTVRATRRSCGRAGRWQPPNDRSRRLGADPAWLARRRRGQRDHARGLTDENLLWTTVLSLWRRRDYFYACGVAGLGEAWPGMAGQGTARQGYFVHFRFLKRKSRESSFIKRGGPVRGKKIPHAGKPFMAHLIAIFRCPGRQGKRQLLVRHKQAGF